MPSAFGFLFDSIRRGVRSIIGYRSPLYVFGSAVLNDISLASKEGLGPAIAIRRLLRHQKPERRTLQLSRLYYPVFVRSGTADIHAVINNVVREEYGLALPPNLNPRTIIDAGAFIGDTSAYFLSRYVEAKVIALEPDDANFALAEENLRPYGDRVDLIKAALWWTDGVLKFSGEFMGAALGETGKEVRALAIGHLIDSVCAEGAVDILKLDIEGAEDDIFLNSPGDWLPKVDHILIELHGPDIQSRVLSTLQMHGFVCSPYRSIWCCSRRR
jgi:FkbM family methyltransferase